MIDCGILTSGIRFRQHLSTEMAHYASDCWDCELLTSYGWIEVVGIADRSCFDLMQHSQHAKVELVAYEQYATPKVENVVVPALDKKKMFTPFGTKTNSIITAVKRKSHQENAKLNEEMKQNGKVSIEIELEENKKETVEVSAEFLTFENKQIRTNGENYVPSVIEPSFGIGRLIYCVLEHSYWVREEEKKVEQDTKKKGKKEEDAGVVRAVLSLPPAIAPYKAAILPMIHNDKEYQTLTNQLVEKLTKHGISYKVDTSGQSIGKRYCRSDDVGVPFAITIDDISFKDGAATLRERDSCEQLRVPIEELAPIIAKLVAKQTIWQDVKGIYPEQKQTASETVGKKK
jgi:glycyl-tRNA synthetase